jgi:hypothetical protein
LSTVSFRLNIIKFVKEQGNQIPKRHFGSPPTKKIICEWRRQQDELKKPQKKRNTFHKNIAKLLYLEAELDNRSQKHWSFWDYTNDYFEERRWEVTHGITDFTEQFLGLKDLLLGTDCET